MLPCITLVSCLGPVHHLIPVDTVFPGHQSPPFHIRPLSSPSSAPSAFQIHSLRQQGSTMDVFNRPTIFILTVETLFFPLSLLPTGS